MITHRLQGIYQIHFALQLLIIVCLYWLHVLGLAYFTGFVSLPYYIFYCILIMLGLILHEFQTTHDYQVGVLHGSLRECHRLASRKALFGMVLLVIYLFATKDKTISRVFFFTFPVVMYSVLLVTDRWIPGSLAKRFFKGVHEQHTLLIGSTTRAGAITRWIERKELLGVRPVGLITDEQGQGEIDGIPILGGFNDLERVIQEKAVTHIMVLEFPFSPKMITKMIYVCDKFAVRFLMVNTLEDYFVHPMTYLEDDGLHLISTRDEPLQHPVNRLLKRTLDICISLPVVIFVLPGMAAIVWFFQRLQSPGPVFYWQRRAGLQNKEFDILKFRTMTTNNPNVAKQASRNDSRIYSAGQIFRKFSIDEFPQFWNVLRGDMSVVGPRPHLIEHNQQFAQVMGNYYIRSFVKPGLTGLAQIKGFRGETKSDDDLIQRVHWDIHYLENWSLELESTIILKTFYKVVFPPKTAY